MTVLFGVWVTPISSLAESLHINVSSRIWANNLSLKFGSGEFTSGYSISLGELSLSIRTDRYFAGLQGGAGSYSFDRRTVCSGSSCSVFPPGELDFRQVEVGGGYYVTPWFGPFLGYLNQTQDFNFETVRGSQNLGAGLLGAIFNWSIFDHREVVFGKVSFVGLGVGDVEGQMAEIGIARLSRAFPLSYSIGVKAQRLSYLENSLVIGQFERSDDVLLGFNIGIYYTLR